jgi:hypothetical protein
MIEFEGRSGSLLREAFDAVYTTRLVELLVFLKSCSFSSIISLYKKVAS